jgi:Sucrase/ferredoxin-like
VIGGASRCSDAALARDEPLSATASLVTAWLLIEQPGAWGPDAVIESGLSADVATTLQRKAANAGVRVLLIRRTGRRVREPVVFLAHSGMGRGRPTMSAGVVADPGALLDLDLDSLAAGRPHGFGELVEHPIYLVCTHGRHDICCADKGRPLFKAMALARPDRVWESSHIGGDRFAGNLLVLPRGDYFGRIDPEHAYALMEGYEAGRLDLDHYRGRSTRPRMVQAAEHFLRTAGSITGIEDVEVVDYRRPAHDHAEVVLRGPDGEARLVVIRTRPSPPAMLTCRAEQPGQAVAYELLSTMRL